MPVNASPSRLEMACRDGGKGRVLNARWLIAGIVLLNILAIGLAGSTVWQARSDHQSRAEHSTRQLALTLEKDLSGILHASEIILVNVREEVAHSRQPGTFDARALSALVERQRIHQPHIDGVYVTDAAGAVLYGMASDADQAAVGVADHAYFSELLKPNADVTVLSAPLRSRVTGAWVLVLARRIVRDNGDFGGAVLVTISIDRLTRTFSQVELPEGGVVALRGQGLGLVARYPRPPAQPEEFLGRRDVSPPLAEWVAAGATSGTFRALTPPDRIERVLSFRKLDGYPLYLIVGRATAEYLAPWHRAVIVGAITTSIFVVLTLLLSWLVLRSWKHLTAANAALEHLAHTDFLTGLMNRRAFLESAEAEIVRSRRYGKPPSLLILDIDHFKEVNDRLGHCVGDAALRQLAEVLRLSFRTVDLLGRWGGEEFVAFMPETSMAGGLDVAERVRETVENAVIVTGTGAPVKLTVSIGVASLMPTDDVDAVIARADTALYRAKNGGRNSVCGADAMPIVSLET